jgi:hypothetical protein
LDEYVQHVSSDRIPKEILKYQPEGKRHLRRALKVEDSIL